MAVVAAHFGLLGHGIGYSFSPGYFRAKFAQLGLPDCRYALYDVPDAAAVRALFRADPALRGLNVTVPHKRAVMPFLDELADAARAIGAVNCIQRLPDATAPDGFRLRGHNTDAPALLHTLRAWYAGPPAGPALVLGTGGAAQAARWALNELGMPATLVSRTGGDLPYDALTTSPTALETFPLLLNCTPVGTFPDLEAVPPVPFERLGPANWVYDLIYNPPQTRLLREAAARGARTHNGLAMLHHQAELAWAIWRE